jgi:7-cyano-7-deazaguanine synthase
MLQSTPVIDKRYHAFVLLSGGADSSTCLAIAREHYPQGDILAISMDYGQRHAKEMESAEAIASYFGADHRIFKLAEQPKSMLTDANSEVPNISYDEIKGVSPTYVWFRNGLMLSQLAAIAHAFAVEDQEVSLYFGAHAEDARSWAYPDCTPEFIGAMANAIYIGTYHKVRLVAPLMNMVKKEIILKGHSLNVPWMDTWSCYKGETYQCGECPTCRSRRAGFIDAGIYDPTIYAEGFTYKGVKYNRFGIIEAQEAAPVKGDKPGDDEIPF